MRRLIYCAYVGASLAIPAAVALAHDPPPAAETAAETAASTPAATEHPLFVDPAADADETVFGDLLVVPPVGAYGRTPLHIDPIHAAFVRDAWVHPAAGEGLRTASGRRVAWEPLPPAAPGLWEAPQLAGGYAATIVSCDRPRVMLLEASGHAMAYVNGTPRAGDPYGTGRMVCPVALRQGDNDLVFHVAAGRLAARLVEPPQPLYFDLRDAVIPDLIADESGPAFAGVLVVNATDQPSPAAQLTSYRAGAQTITAAVPALPPLGVRRLVVPIDGHLTEDEIEAGSVRVQIDLTLPGNDGERRLADSKAFDLAVVATDALHTRTFLSRIDGSAQPYAVLPAGATAVQSQPATTATAPGVLLALHPSGTPPLNMLRGTPPLPGTHILAPLGRRTFGFDWEDWSRIDALEVLADFRTRAAIDPHRVAICGQADGGHGALRLAALHPDRFAATAAVDGWLDYFLYGTSMPAWSQPDRVQELLLACGNDQRLPPLLGNLAPLGVSVQCDPRAPAALVQQSRTLRAALSEFHADFAYRESLGDENPAGSPALSADVTAFLTSRQLPPDASVDLLSFATPNPGLAARCRWVTILAAQDPGEFCRVGAACDDAARTIRVGTENVAGLRIDLGRLAPGAPVAVSIDSEPLREFPWPEGGAKQLRFLRRNDQWQLVPAWPQAWKRPQRSGGFRSVWDRRIALVYGTQGTSEENAWAVAKARFDAEQFLVRGGGAALVAADEQFDADGDPHRNIVLYGNADTNSQWSRLLSESPVQVRTGQVIVGGRPEAGAELACLLVRPRPGSPTALVGAVSGTGVVGMRATDRLPLFVSGVRLPDLLLFDADAATRGVREIRAAGWFGLDWSVPSGRFAWRETAL